jgi:hypothetical protein
MQNFDFFQTSIPELKPLLKRSLPSISTVRTTLFLLLTPYTSIFTERWAVMCMVSTYTYTYVTLRTYTWSWTWVFVLPSIVISFILNYLGPSNSRYCGFLVLELLALSHSIYECAARPRARPLSYARFTYISTLFYTRLTCL